MPISPTFEENIKLALAGNLIDVELDTPTIQYAFDKAVKIFKQRGNNNLDRKFYPLSVTTDTTVYTLPTSENIDTIIQIIRPKSTLSPNDPFSMSFIQETFGYGVLTGSSLLTYELGKQMIENVEIYTSKSVQYIWKKRLNELTLLTKPKVNETWMLEVYADLSNAEYENLIWIEQYTLAECKIILGRAYRKFSSISTPAGEASLDGEQLVSDGKEEQTFLIENIKEFVDGGITGYPIVIG